MAALATNSDNMLMAIMIMMMIMTNITACGVRVNLEQSLCRPGFTLGLQYSAMICVILVGNCGECCHRASYLQSPAPEDDALSVRPYELMASEAK